MTFCVVCERPTGSNFYLKIYCRACAPVVRQIQSEVKMAMAAACIPAATGKLCVDCGKPATARDHRYYSRPLEVDYVCSGCNTVRGPTIDIADLVNDRLERRKALGM